jgi:hypothetical protein
LQTPTGNENNNRIMAILSDNLFVTDEIIFLVFGENLFCDSLKTVNLSFQNSETKTLDRYCERLVFNRLDVTYLLFVNKISAFSE